jgi:adenylyltransferase/sulfurtransferase
VAARKLARFGPLVETDARPIRFAPATSGQFLRGADVVLDGTDSFETRFAVNDACCAAGVALVHGAVLGWTGQILTVLPRRGSCLRCLFEGPPPTGTVPTCSEAGVATPLCGVIGATMAAEATRVLRAVSARAAGRLLVWEGATGRRREIPVRPDPVCPACGAPPRAERHP